MKRERSETDQADVHEMRAAERRMQRDLSQHRRRESALVLRLSHKERESAEMSSHLSKLQQSQQPQQAGDGTLLLDPATHAEIMRLREEVERAGKKEREVQEELQASQYQSGSILGKKLMNKCKELQAENDQLGKDLSEGRVRKLRADALLHKEHVLELQKALAETHEWVGHLTDELNTSSALVASLRRELKAAKGE